MKELILKLRLEGKSYREIEKIAGCSKGLISYHCGVGQKEKYQLRAEKHKKKDCLTNRVFHYRKRKRKLNHGVRDFQRRTKEGYENSAKQYSFTDKDVIKKFGINTKCYLSGVKINLLKDNFYELDHINSVCNGGDNSLENLGVAHKIANQMKRSLTVDELLIWCEKILKNNNYIVKKKK
jgi:hypothetical protein